MPQIRKGGKFVFGWSNIKNDFSIQFPKDAINEYDICSEGKVFLITGSRTTGGFAVSKKTFMEKSIFNNVFLQYNDLGDYKTKEGDFFQYKSRKYTWVIINNEGKIFLNKNILNTLCLNINDKLLSIRSSNIAFMMGVKGPLINEANNYNGIINMY
jgi:hypothetical protein